MVDNSNNRVDTWEMVVVHRAFRREFRELPGLIRGVAAQDKARADFVGEHAADFNNALHHHHTSEDDFLWPLLLQRVGELNTELVERMERQHETVATLLEQVEKLLPRWRETADPATRDELADVLEKVSLALDEHLTEEENEVLPLVSVHITQAEWEELGRRGVESLPKGRKGFLLLGAILQDATPDELPRFLGLVPPPVRLLWKVYGTRAHRKHVAQLHQTAA